MDLYSVKKELQNLADILKEECEKEVINTFAQYVLNRAIPDFEKLPKQENESLLAAFWDEYITLHSNAAVKYYIEVLASQGSKWSGGYSVYNMIEQIRRDAILEHLALQFVTRDKIKKRMFEMVEECES